jgi:hypothetical protein
MIKQTGCEHGRITRLMFTDFVKETNDKLAKIEQNTNHFSQRLPSGAVWIISILMGVIGLIAGLKL